MKALAQQASRDLKRGFLAESDTGSSSISQCGQTLCNVRIGVVSMVSPLAVLLECRSKPDETAEDSGTTGVVELWVIVDHLAAALSHLRSSLPPWVLRGKRICCSA